MCILCSVGPWVITPFSKMGDDTGGLLDEAIISIKQEGNAKLRDTGRNVLAQHIRHCSIFRPCIREFI